MKFLTWNIGSFVHEKYVRMLYSKQAERFEYFRPEQNANLVNTTITTLNPDIVFLQEFYEPGDIESITALTSYRYRYTLDMWYRNGGAHIASNTPLEVTSMPTGALMRSGSLTCLAIHLNSYSTSKRYSEVMELLETVRDAKNLIIFGDTNMWMMNHLVLLQNDRSTYRALTNNLIDHTHTIGPTTPYGFSLDRVFSSPHLSVEIGRSKTRGASMDHYPVYFSVTS